MSGFRRSRVFFFSFFLKCPLSNYRLVIIICLCKRAIKYYLSEVEDGMSYSIFMMGLLVTSFILSRKILV